MILLLSTSDTDLLSARSSGADWRLANPSRRPGRESDTPRPFCDACVASCVTGCAKIGPQDLPALLDGVDLVVVRLLGGRRAWEDGLDALLAGPVPVVVLGGEQAPDPELMQLSTVPTGVVAETHTYLTEGGPANLRELWAFLSDTVLLTGHGFEPPVVTPSWGHLERTPTVTEGPAVGVLYYRAHELSGNTGFVESLCQAVEARGARAVPVFCASLRTAEQGMLDVLGTLDALVVTVLASGGTRPAAVSAGEDDTAWDVGALAALDIPMLQGLCLTSSRASWADSSDGLSPLDTATQVAVPEFDGRLITVPFSFKETGEDGLTHYVADPERAARVAGIAYRHAVLRHTPPAERKVAVVLSAYPTKHARIGNAVGLDTPASVVRLLTALREQGYDVGPESGPDALPGLAELDGDALVHALIAAGGQDEDWLTQDQLEGGTVRMPAARYQQSFDRLPQDLRDAMTETWGEAPGQLFVDGGDIVIAGLVAGNVVVMVQPPRGFGANPIAIYHDPDLPPSHHYVAAYRWVDEVFGADAVVHVGKHGNLEWLPGKNLGMSASCGTDAALGDLPLVYPFLVNDPGEGTQAKRRAHATLVDHLVPPMARAESYGDLARLEQLLDEHANVAAMDPAKLPAIRAQIWTLIQAAKLDHDLGLTDRPQDEGFDDFILHVDGWLCEVKDVQVRDGLHVLGQPPVGDARVDLVLAMLRARQIWGGNTQALPGLRQALGMTEDGDESRELVDATEATARTLVKAADDAGWTDISDVAREVLGHQNDDVEAILQFAADEVLPRLEKTTDELTMVLHALDGGYVPAGPSGSPLRGLINVLPTGRNFYSVDPKAVPSRLAYETGWAMAESLLTRYREETGEWPRSVGLSAWGTSAMRTSGDDVGEILALLGVRPVWDEASRRVADVQVVPLEELGRPRIDVTVRISGFFRDAFPHVVSMMDDAVRLVAGLDEPAEDNYVRAHVLADRAEGKDEREATIRVFGSKPGAYGAGLLQLMDARTWQDDADLAEVYGVWGGYAYGRAMDGVPARPAMESAYKRIAVAAKNIDTREHDVLDSGDYFEYHGGMIATVRALTGTSPKAYLGDSTRPEAVRTRSLVEETSRIFRARVVNPKWVEAMRRHGYKGAFEMAATVDYLFGWDATTGVVGDWMYEKVSETYVLDAENRAFLEKSNPWALHGMVERLLEAADRKLWDSPPPELLEQLREVYLQTEGDLEGDS